MNDDARRGSGRGPDGPRGHGGARVETVQEALARAAGHARAASAEATRAVRALLDAISLLQGGVSAESNALLSRAALWLDAVATGLAGADGDAVLTRALAEALDAEIARWEQRAGDDPEARAVLRAFLGLRELLWELGVRPAPGADEASSQDEVRTHRATRRRRVERVPVQG